MLLVCLYSLKGGGISRIDELETFAMVEPEQERKEEAVVMPRLSLEERVAAVLQARMGRVSRQIAVTAAPDVDGGIVLSGEVPTFHNKQIAWQIAVRVAEVKKVFDRISVR